MKHDDEPSQTTAPKIIVPSSAANLEPIDAPSSVVSSTASSANQQKQKVPGGFKASRAEKYTQASIVWARSYGHGCIS